MSICCVCAEFTAKFHIPCLHKVCQLCLDDIRAADNKCPICRELCIETIEIITAQLSSEFRMNYIHFIVIISSRLDLLKSIKTNTIRDRDLIIKHIIEGISIKQKLIANFDQEKQLVEDEYKLFEKNYNIKIDDCIARIEHIDRIEDTLSSIIALPLDQQMEYGNKLLENKNIQYKSPGGLWFPQINPVRSYKNGELHLINFKENTDKLEDAILITFQDCLIYMSQYSSDIIMGISSKNYEDYYIINTEKSYKIITDIKSMFKKILSDGFIIHFDIIDDVRKFYCMYNIDENKSSDILEIYTANKYKFILIIGIYVMIIDDTTLICWSFVKKDIIWTRTNRNKRIAQFHNLYYIHVDNTLLDLETGSIIEGDVDFTKIAYKPTYIHAGNQIIDETNTSLIYYTINTNLTGIRYFNIFKLVDGTIILHRMDSKTMDSKTMYMSRDRRDLLPNIFRFEQTGPNTYDAFIL
jgi:hypothetical protein